ncbi:hypothetical protein [Microvirga pudoricolor]|uniref:hypothetical protein n=1 Tax=Microvirga pudoricolor TaxID=2778729 RepID=UPI0019501134|nr:hypothetical protein [Microvirga pudoricolor]
MISDYAPLAIVAVLALCVLWVVIRILGALFRRRPERQDPPMEAATIAPSRQEPRLVAEAAPVSAARPDAADLRNLQESIDRLAQQVSLLERRLGERFPDPGALPGEAITSSRSSREASPEAPIIPGDRV